MCGVHVHRIETCDILNMHSSLYQYPLLQGRGGGGQAGRSRGERGGVMQDLGYELPRIPIPRTRVNKLTSRASPDSSVANRGMMLIELSYLRPVLSKRESCAGRRVP